ncbi:MAG: addiction module toxin RelE [Bacteroidetes bacterium HGW-Bacteroidetes-23]|nr:MAG: addiction module toxin RelE [Bacteroidetes bacterium HGW-Bacteroidetes-23]
MEIVNRKLLEKLKHKNKGNVGLVSAIDLLLNDLEENEFESQAELQKIRPDADCVHNDGFYFFNINVHRTLILIEFDENGEITIVWCGTHDEYELTFKNNKNTIRKWLKDREWIK